MYHESLKSTSRLRTNAGFEIVPTVRFFKHFWRRRHTCFDKLEDTCHPLFLVPSPKSLATFRQSFTPRCMDEISDYICILKRKPYAFRILHCISKYLSRNYFEISGIDR